MPASFLSRHRTICDVLEEIRSIAERGGSNSEIVSLCNEASTYAKRMSAKLAEYKEQFNGR